MPPHTTWGLQRSDTVKTQPPCLQRRERQGVEADFLPLSRQGIQTVLLLSKTHHPCLTTVLLRMPSEPRTITAIRLMTCPHAVRAFPFTNSSCGCIPEPKARPVVQVARSRLKLRKKIEGKKSNRTAKPVSGSNSSHWKYSLEAENAVRIPHMVSSVSGPLCLVVHPRHHTQSNRHSRDRTLSDRFFGRPRKLRTEHVSAKTPLRSSRNRVLTPSWDLLRRFKLFCLTDVSLVPARVLCSFNVSVRVSPSFVPSMREWDDSVREGGSHEWPRGPSCLLSLLFATCRMGE